MQVDKVSTARGHSECVGSNIDGNTSLPNLLCDHAVIGHADYALKVRAVVEPTQLKHHLLHAADRQERNKVRYTDHLDW